MRQQQRSEAGCEAAVIAAPIAHGVEVRAGHQYTRIGARGRIRRISADYVADGIDTHLHTGRFHPFGQQGLRRPVGGREEGAGEAAFHVRELGERFGAVKNALSERVGVPCHGCGVVWRGARENKARQREHGPPGA